MCKSVCELCVVVGKCVQYVKAWRKYGGAGEYVGEYAGVYGGGGSTGEVLGGSMWVWNLYKILGVLQYGSRIR